ncbi:16S rRNA (guanine(966)-N(2))-methyltransferase RsmD [Bowmanella yangjiangensis]|uniref:Ribosomal RNA small subunit methyltransferase D n=1 Tax=Bowmanella yangjiangensis TaxID=2811230 RepID=A0ABS3CXS6_9ALTE|nr:16S rRNA (guanine(966)-N(2))-methyltransferase RsmD [Bowmanella yangjiangensis]MBN7821927.1 16S rRNA (guanine(966)-N(2))-methyltransferase RsmD [Bowmanella yangjiangensis]
MKRAVKSPAAALGSIRIIGGRWRGRKLPVMDLDGLRPTTDRTKETLFNWLAAYVADSHCLDAFAGTGGLGLEALSRHAASATFVEQDRQAAQLLEKNIQTLGAHQQAKLIKGGVQAYLSSCTERFDLVFLDPPFHQSLLGEVIPLLSANKLLNHGALIYVEAEVGALLPIPCEWQLLKQKQTKQVSYQLYQYQEITCKSPTEQG